MISTFLDKILSLLQILQDVVNLIQDVTHQEEQKLPFELTTAFQPHINIKCSGSKYK